MKVHAGNDNEQNNQIFIRISVEKYENGGFHGDFLVPILLYKNPN